MSMLPPDPDSNPLDAWREALAIALQGQYGSAKTWATVSEQARDGWRVDAAEIMASLPEDPQTQRVRELHSPHGEDPAWCSECGLTYPCWTIRILNGEAR